MNCVFFVNEFGCNGCFWVGIEFDRDIVEQCLGVDDYGFVVWFWWFFCFVFDV